MPKLFRHFLFLYLSSFYLSFQLSFRLKLIKTTDLATINIGDKTEGIGYGEKVDYKNEDVKYGQEFSININGNNKFIAGYFVFDGIMFTTESPEWKGGTITEEALKIDNSEYKKLNFDINSNQLSFTLPNEDEVKNNPEKYKFVPRYNCFKGTTSLPFDSTSFDLKDNIQPKPEETFTLVVNKGNDFKGELYQGQNLLLSFPITSTESKFIYKTKESKRYVDYISFYIERDIGNKRIRDCEIQKFHFVICEENCNCMEGNFCFSCQSDSGMKANDNKCYKKKELISYYRKNNKYYKCYTSCKTCSKEGTQDTHNCESCSDSYPYERRNSDSLNCYETCPDGTFIPNSGRECLAVCDEDHPYVFKRKCLAGCPKSYKPQENICVIEIIPISEGLSKTEARKDELEKFISENIKDYIGMIIEGKGFKCEIYSTDKNKKDSSDISSFDLGNCEKKIKKKHNIDEKTPLIIYKTDAYDDSIIPKVRFKIFNIEGEEFEANVCNEDKFEISYPIKDKDKIKLKTAKKMFDELNVDLYNAKDKFFNDICVPYSESGNGDVVLKDRREYLYLNFTLCDKGCSFIGFDYNTSRSKCQCNLYFEENDDDDEKQEFDSLANSLWESTNLVLFKCYKLAFTHKTLHDIGFYTFGIFILIQIASSIALSYEIKLIYLKIFNSLFEGKRKKSKHVNKSTVLIKSFSLPENEDKNNFFLYFSIIFSKIDLVKILFFRDENDLYSLGITSYLFSLSNDFAMNAFMYSDDIISQKYHKQLNKYTNFFLSVISNSVGYLISAVIVKLISY